MPEKFFEKITPGKRTESDRIDENEVKKKFAEFFLEKELKITTEKYKSDEKFKETFTKLDAVAKKDGLFEGVMVKKSSKDITSGGFVLYELPTGKLIIAEYPSDKVSLGEDILKNIKDFFETDEDSARKGFSIIFDHEDQHRKGKAREEYEAEKQNAEKIIKDTKDIEEARKKIEESHCDYYSRGERQAELQRTADSENLAQDMAMHWVAADIAKNGFSELSKFRFEYNPKRPGLSFINDKNIIKEIHAEAEKIRVELVNKYNEKHGIKI